MSQVRRGFHPGLLSVALYLLFAAALLVIILVRTGGHFSYCLDDPYIHLALAERIRHGLYGLNAGEPASPSSSILWPLLFVPFAGTAVMPWLPLLLNLLCGAGTSWLLGSWAERTFGVRGRGAGSRWRVFTLAALLVMALNLIALTFTGLEHSLQLLLCVACAVAATRAMQGERLSAWALVAAVLLPSVRYEGLLITAGLAIALAGRRAWRTGAGILLGSAAFPAAFSLFLHRQGLPWFPLSVLVKSSYKFQDQRSWPHKVARLLYGTVKQSLFDLERLPELILTAWLIALAWKHRRTRGRCFALSGAALVGATQVVLGPVGWFYRYEIYALAFTLLVALAASALPAADRMAESDPCVRSREATEIPETLPRVSAPYTALRVPAAALAGVAVLALIYSRPLVLVPRAAIGIYEQQYQLGRLTGEFYHAPVAVNDLGWVAFRRTPDQYTLDLYGLGSYEAFRTKEKDRTPEWLDTITRERHVGLVAIYPEWFRQGVPASWTPAAKLCAADVDISLGPVSQRVMVYRTPDASAQDVNNALRQWRDAMPPHVALQLQPEDTSAVCR